jgi:hypothetical protein
VRSSVEVFPPLGACNPNVEIVGTCYVCQDGFIFGVPYLRLPIAGGSVPFEASEAVSQAVGVLTP